MIKWNSDLLKDCPKNVNTEYYALMLRLTLSYSNFMSMIVKGKSKQIVAKAHTQ
jgi:hypothetical protein